MKKRNHSRVGNDFSRGLGLYRMRGGHMLDVIQMCLIVGLLTWCTVVVAFAWAQTPAYSLGGFVRYHIAGMIDWVSPFASARLGWSVPTDVGPSRFTFATILADPWHQERAEIFWRAMLFGMISATGAVLLLGYPVYGLIRRHGQKASASEIVRGPKLIEDYELADLLRNQGIASDIMIGSIPLVASTETENILMIGGIGTGKTEAIKHMLDVIQARGETAIVYDTKGQLYGQYYDQDRGDVLLNPLDQRCARWSPWAEFVKATHPQALAEAMVPESSKNESFWHTAARVLLRETLILQMNDPDRSVGKLVNVILNTSRAELERLLRGTPAARYLDEALEKMGGSIRSNLDTYIEPLKYLAPDAGGDGDFSIRKFIGKKADGADEHGGSWLWLTSQSDDHEAITPLLATWIGLAVSALLSLPIDRSRRIWFILDEIASLKHLSKFVGLMERGREHGGCVVLGLQDISQLETHYGRSDAQTIMGQLSTKVIFRLDSPESCRWASDSIGRVEISEVSESARYDPGDTESDIHLSAQTREKPLVLASEISNLATLNCYVKLAGAFPVARTELLDPEATFRPMKNTPFVPTNSWALRPKPSQLGSTPSAQNDAPDEHVAADRPRKPAADLQADIKKTKMRFGT